jgi:hypothetical protein
VSEWSWEWLPSFDEVAAGLPAEVLTAVEKAAGELATVNSMVYLDGIDFQGAGPGVRTHADPARNLFLEYLTVPRHERIYLVHVTWVGP